MTFKEFKKFNDMSKRYAPAVGKLLEVNMASGMCTLEYGGARYSISIVDLVNSILTEGKYVLANPKLLKDWRGFTK